MSRLRPREDVLAHCLPLQLRPAAGTRGRTSGTTGR
jgi:hypothetical protein